MNRESLNENAYSMKELFKLVRLNFKFLFISSGMFSILALIYAVSLDDIYSSEALLSPAQSLQGPQPSLSAGGAIGGLVGLGIPSSSSNKTILALQVIETKDFFKSFYEQDEFLKELSASESYNKEKGLLSFDDSKYSEGAWIAGMKPNLQKAHRDFMDLLTIDHDRLDGFVRIKIDHISPYVAKKWVEKIISQLNYHVAVKEKLAAERSVEFLQKQVLNSNKVDLKLIFSSMMVKQYETIMLSEVTDEFVFEVLDKPRVPDKKSKPSRFFVIVFLSIFGAFISFLLVLFLSASGKFIELNPFPPRIVLRKISD